MDTLYIALVDTPGFFAALIRRAVQMDYVHVALSLNEELTEAYSVGRRNPFIPFFAGFEKEDAKKILRKFPDARYRIAALPCTDEQKDAVRRQLAVCYRERHHYHYCILGLPFILLQKPFYRKGHYTCTSFTARLLEENGIRLFDKHFSTVTPRDFYELSGVRVIYEGRLADWMEQKSPAYGKPVRGILYEG